MRCPSRLANTFASGPTSAVMRMPGALSVNTGSYCHRDAARNCGMVMVFDRFRVLPSTGRPGTTGMDEAAPEVVARSVGRAGCGMRTPPEVRGRERGEQGFLSGPGLTPAGTSRRV